MEHIAGNASLAMIYAEGKGVRPNLTLATRFACEIRGDWDNGEPVAEMLDVKRGERAVKVDFDICATPTGRQLNYLCLVRDRRRVDAKVAAAERRFDQGSPHLHELFKDLLAARGKFLAAHSVEEPNGNSGAVQSALQDEIEIDQAWADQLDRLRMGQLPRTGPQDFKQVDDDLNAAYQKALKSAETGEDADISAVQLRQLERAWIKYRDAWIAYGTLRWPGISADSWRTWLTKDQLEDLKQLAL